jgi:hypothetical protein
MPEVTPKPRKYRKHAKRKKNRRMSARLKDMRMGTLYTIFPKLNIDTKIFGRNPRGTSIVFIKTVSGVGDHDVRVFYQHQQSFRE